MSSPQTDIVLMVLHENDADIPSILVRILAMQLSSAVLTLVPSWAIPLVKQIYI